MDLNTINFHDRNLIQLNFIFIKKELNIVLDGESNYLSLHFHNISNLSIDSLIQITEVEDIELFSMEEVMEKDREIYFTFLLGFGKPSFTLKFSFNRVEIKKINLSEM